MSLSKMDVSELTDDQLKEAAKIFSQKKKEELDLFILEDLKKKYRILESLRDNPEVLKAFFPEHQDGRYGDKCSDQDTARGFDHMHAPKDPHCELCLILDAITELQWSDPEHPSHNICELNLLLEARLY